ncbi:MAG: drug/metabolite transporter (DMT)-like permease [Planctomycetota bacterium]|jgi:drug/metabolite transporter (DMT)-like permease
MALLPGADGVGAISAAQFTALRLLSGALVLAPVLLRPRPGHVEVKARTWALAATALLVYAFAFSLSYVTIPAGIGALLLFGTVQVLMLGVALARGERMGLAQWAGFAAAIAGILVLVGPSAAESADRLDWLGALLMILAGVGWGIYTLLGRGAVDPVRMTARNFAASAPFAALLGAWAWWGSDVPPTARGVLLSVVSGAVTSGAGYAIWYAALRGHTRTSAAAVQLLVPILAALGGVVLLDEALTLRFGASAALVLGGVAFAVLLPAPAVPRSIS